MTYSKTKQDIVDYCIGLSKYDRITIDHANNFIEKLLNLVSQLEKEQTFGELKADDKVCVHRLPTVDELAAMGYYDTTAVYIALNTYKDALLSGSYVIIQDFTSWNHNHPAFEIDFKTDVFDSLILPPICLIKEQK